MQFSILINQSRAVEWGLTAPQAMLFAFVYGVSGWADSIMRDGRVYFFLNRQKVCSEMPLLTDKPDTVYRLLRQLEAAGVIRMLTESNRPYVSITEKGAAWNSSNPANFRSSEVGKKSEPRGSGSEKNPSRVGKKSEPGSEIFPTDHITIDHITNISSDVDQSGVVVSVSGGAQKKQSSRGSRLPVDWVLPAGWRADALAIDRRLGLMIEVVADRFRDYWVSVAGARGVKLDWRATWRNWCRREAERFPAQGFAGVMGRGGAGGASRSVGQGGSGSGQDLRSRSLEQDLMDRSWADSKSGG